MNKNLINISEAINKLPYNFEKFTFVNYITSLHLINKSREDPITGVHNILYSMYLHLMEVNPEIIVESMRIKSVYKNYHIIIVK